MPYLIHHFNGSPITHIELKDRISIGRGEGNHLQIDDVTISSDHAVIERIDEGSFQVRDLDSTNGVFYKGRKIAQQTLSDGDFVVIGTHDLQFVTALPDPLSQTARIKKSWIPGIFYTGG